MAGNYDGAPENAKFFLAMRVQDLSHGMNVDELAEAKSSKSAMVTRVNQGGKGDHETPDGLAELDCSCQNS
ncbi:MAG: hypothetical protein AB1813_11540 [Verrucomicrobiota bacterium]